MTLRSGLVFLLCLLCVALGLPRFVEKQRALVILDSMDQVSEHGLFFAMLDKRGYTLTFETAGSKSLGLGKFGQWDYDNVILFAPKANELGNGVTVQTLFDFVDQGGNVLAAAATSKGVVGKVVRAFAGGSGMHFADGDAATLAMDHVHFDEMDKNGPHSLLNVHFEDQVLENEYIFPEKDRQKVKTKAKGIMYRGSGMVLDIENELAFAVAWGKATSYLAPMFGSIKDYPLASGNDVVLVGALQARNNARVVVSGSIEMFGDAFYGNRETANAVFCDSLTEWAFLERGQLRLSSVFHAKHGESQPPDVYRIMDMIDFSMVIEEKKDGEWVPFVAKDVQLEFIMLDPWVRTNVPHVGGGKYALTFKAPDVPGIYTFSVNYMRKGLSGVFVNIQHPVRPFKHDEYERFLKSAYPYYVSVFVMLAAVFVFSTVFLFHREKK